MYNVCLLYILLLIHILIYYKLVIKDVYIQIKKTVILSMYIHTYATNIPKYFDIHFFCIC